MKGETNWEPFLAGRIACAGEKISVTLVRMPQRSSRRAVQKRVLQQKAVWTFPFLPQPQRLHAAQRSAVDKAAPLHGKAVFAIADLHRDLFQPF